MIPLADPEMLTPRGLADREVQVHPTARVDTLRIGPGTRIGPGVKIGAGAKIGRGCLIDGPCSIDGKVVLGERVTVNAGVEISGVSLIEDDVVLGADVVLLGEPSGKPRALYGRFTGVTIRRGAQIGAGATLYPGVEIGAGAIVEENAIVTCSVASNTHVAGQPAREIEPPAALNRSNVR